MSRTGRALHRVARMGLALSAILTMISLSASGQISTGPGNASAALQPHDAILVPSPWVPVLIGPYVGPDYTLHRGNFRLYEDGILCCDFERGDGWGFTAGLRAFFPLGFTSYISPRIGYTRHAGAFSTRTGPFPFRGLGDSVETIYFTEELSTPLPAFAADLFFLQRIDSSLGLYIGGGPSVEYLAEARFTKSDRITSPEGVTWLDGTTERVQQIDFEVEAADLVFGGRLGLVMLYPITDWLFLNPELTASLPISVVSEKWRMFEVQGTVGVMVVY